MEQLRHGRKLAQAAHGDVPAKAAHGVVPATASPMDFERDQLKQLQRKDPEFLDIFLALETLQHVAEGEGDGATNDHIFKKLKTLVPSSDGRNRAKRADAAVNQMQHYLLHDGVLHRKVHDR